MNNLTTAIITLLLVASAGIPGSRGAAPIAAPVEIATTKAIPITDPVDLQKVLPIDSQLISLKIRNQQKEVIAKWLEKGVFVTPRAMKFLKRASSGSYDIEVVLLDGTEKKFIYTKK